ncbi:MAG: hypothetical protein QMB94_01185, partial [Phycisphaerales bacterium]
MTRPLLATPRGLSLATMIGVMLSGNLTCAATFKSTEGAERRRSVANALFDEDVSYLVSILENTAVPRVLRVGAANRLARLGSPEAAEAIGAALELGSETTRQVLIEGVRASDRTTERVVSRVCSAALAGLVPLDA